MTGYIYMVVVCISISGAPPICLPAGNPFVGSDPSELCQVMADHANQTAPPNAKYYCVKQERWRQ